MKDSSVKKRFGERWPRGTLEVIKTKKKQTRQPIPTAENGFAVRPNCQHVTVVHVLFSPTFTRATIYHCIYPIYLDVKSVFCFFPSNYKILIR